jgi:hypothetical protein
MSMTSLKQSIARITDRKQLQELQAYCKERGTLLWKREEARSAAEAWERCKGLPVGTMLYCNASGIFLGGAIQCGTALRVYAPSQPRAKRIWATVVKDGKDEGVYWFGPEGIHRYDLRTERPARATSDRLAGLAEEVGKVLNDIK